MLAVEFLMNLAVHLFGQGHDPTAPGGCSVGEVAELMRRGKEAVPKLLLRGLARLTELLDERKEGERS